MRNLIKKIAYPFLKSWYTNNNSKPRKYKKYGIGITVFPGVFHPGIFLSTNLFIQFLNDLPLEGKKILELGAGSGLISFFLAQKKQAIVTASDINTKALEGLHYNSQLSGISINVVDSNLFDNLIPNDFDYIIINPPYYPKTPGSETEQAFYCGEHFEYFEKLFNQLSQKCKFNTTKIFMILSEDCQLDTIEKIALTNNIQMELVRKMKRRTEKNYIFTFTIREE